MKLVVLILLFYVADSYGQSTDLIVYDAYCQLTVDDTTVIFDQLEIDLISEQFGKEPKQKKAKNVYNFEKGRTFLRDFHYCNGIVLLRDISDESRQFLSLTLLFEGKSIYDGKLLFYGIELSKKSTFEELYSKSTFKKLLLDNTDYDNDLPDLFYVNVDNRQTLKFEYENGQHYLKKVEIRTCTSHQKKRSGNYDLPKIEIDPQKKAGD